jgi:hypothetical protein
MTRDPYPAPTHPLLKRERHKLAPAARAGLYKYAGVRKHKPKDGKP